MVKEKKEIKTTNKIERKLEGVVISDKMNKTVVVEVKRLKIHPKYQKRYTVSEKYKCHDEEGQYKAGDVVIIRQCKPISKDKRYVVVSKKENK